WSCCQVTPTFRSRRARGGANTRLFVNIALSDSRNPRDARFIERLGFYNPIACNNEEGLRLALDRVEHWRHQGAKLSDTVAGLVKKATVAGNQQATPPQASAA